MLSTLTGGGGTNGRRCPHDSKLLTVDETDRAHVCVSCGYREQFGADRKPLVTREDARSLVAAFRTLQAAGIELPTRRVPGAGREVTR